MATINEVENMFGTTGVNDNDKWNAFCEHFSNTDAVRTTGNMLIRCNCCMRHAKNHAHGMKPAEQQTIAKLFPELDQKDYSGVPDEPNCQGMSRHLFRFMIRAHVIACPPLVSFEHNDEQLVPST